MVYGHLFEEMEGVTEEEKESLRVMGRRWKSYVTSGTWVYEQHPFWITYVPPLPSRRFITDVNERVEDGRSGISRLRHLICSSLSRRPI